MNPKHKIDQEIQKTLERSACKPLFLYTNPAAACRSKIQTIPTRSSQTCTVYPAGNGKYRHALLGC